MGLFAHSLDDRAHDLLAGRVAQGMGDPVPPVAPFAAERQVAVDAVELRAPLDQFLDPFGPLAHDPFHDPAIAQVAARPDVSALCSSNVSSARAPWQCPLPLLFDLRPRPW